MGMCAPGVKILCEHGQQGSGNGILAGNGHPSMGMSAKNGIGDQVRSAYQPALTGWSALGLAPPPYLAGLKVGLVGALATAWPRSKVNWACCTMPRRSQAGSYSSLTWW